MELSGRPVDVVPEQPRVAAQPAVEPPLPAGRPLGLVAEELKSLLGRNGVVLLCGYRDGEL